MSSSSVGDSDKENLFKVAPHLQDQLNRSAKRVLFSPLPDLLQPSAESQPDLLKLPHRPILKRWDTSSSPISSPLKEIPNPMDSFAVVRHAIQALKGIDRASKIETYSNLSNLFRVFPSGTNDDQILEHIPALFDCILRDVTEMSQEDATIPDFPLNTKALKVVGFLCYDSRLNEAIPPNLAKSLIAHSLAKMESSKVTKATATLYLWLWHTQQLSKSVITADVAERMLSASLKVDFPSLIINQERHSVYTRLLEVSQDCMVKHVNLWLPRVINHLLDDNKQIRASALRTAHAAGKRLCRVPAVGRSVQNHLKSEVSGLAFIQVTASRFKHIIQETDGGAYVAEAWGAVCTLSSSQNPEKSKTLMAWMNVLQLVFNSPVMENKVAAQYAWIRMIHYFGNNGDIVYREKNLAYLTKPMSRMFLPDVKTPDAVRIAAVSTISALLYTLIRPSISHVQIDAIWSEVVQVVLELFFNPIQKELFHQHGVSILTALLQIKPIEPWNLERLLSSDQIDEKALMYLEPRWVRSNMAKISPLIVIALRSSATREAKLKLWKALQGSLRHASAKEIQISTDTMEATANLCTVFRTLYLALPLSAAALPAQSEVSCTEESFVADLILSALTDFGISPFTERTLRYSDDSGEFSVPTASGRGAMSDNTGTGLQFIFSLFQYHGRDRTRDLACTSLLENILITCIMNQKSVRKCMTLLTQCLSCIPKIRDVPASHTWRMIASIAAQRLSRDTEANIIQSPSTSGGPDVEDVCSSVQLILAFGTTLDHSVKTRVVWTDLVNSLVKRMISTRHGKTIIPTVVEPLSCLLLSEAKLETVEPQIQSDRLEYISCLILAARMVISELRTQEIDSDVECSARQVSMSVLYQLIASTLQRLPIVGGPETRSFLSLSGSLLKDSPRHDALAALEHMQVAIHSWIESSQSLRNDLIETYLMCIGRYAPTENLSLAKCAPVFSKCFNISEPVLRENAIAAWNASFGKSARLEYPAFLVEAIKAAQLPLGSLQLPTWPEQDPELIETTSVDHNNDQEDAPRPRQSSATTKRKQQTKQKSATASPMSPPRTRASRQSSNAIEPSVVPKADSKKRRRKGTNEGQPAAHHGDESEQSPRRKRPRKEQDWLRQGLPDAMQQDDVFADDGSDAFTLRKREVRIMSPDIASDPVSESSPSVYSRVRRSSSLAAAAAGDPPTMGDLRRATKSLSPAAPNEPLVLGDDDDDDNRPGEIGHDDGSPSRTSRTITSDDLMQLQIRQQNMAPQVLQDLNESIDEDLFIIQLEQYRTSLSDGRPITPKRRGKLGVLMREIARLSGEVTEAYFNT